MNVSSRCFGLEEHGMERPQYDLASEELAMLYCPNTSVDADDDHNARKRGHATLASSSRAAHAERGEEHR